MNNEGERATFGALVLPNEGWGELVQRWTVLDEGGLDSVWSCDHFTNPHRPGAAWFEGSVTLAGLAQATSHASVGLLVGAIVSRSPTMLAKQAQAIDHLNNGRLIVGLGAGGAVSDQQMWGVPEWGSAERVGRFAEYVELVERLLREDTVSFEGRWYRTEQAGMAPGCVQRPRPPLLLAGHGPMSLRVVARFADTWNTFGPTLDDAVQNSRQLDNACVDASRDPSEIRRSVLFGDPPYAGSGLTTTPPDTVTALLQNTIPALRAEFA